VSGRFAGKNVGAEALAGELLLRHGWIGGGAELLGRSLGSEPDADPLVHARLAGALLHLNDLPAAVEHYQSAALLPDDGCLADSGLGIALTLQGRLDDALDAHRRALSAAPGGPDSPHALLMTWNASHTLLASGRLQAGWDAYEARIPLGLGPHEITRPTWDTRIEPGSVLVLAEQGVADEVMFASCLPDLLAEVTAVFVECDPRLVSLFARSFPSARVGPHRAWSGSDLSATGGDPELAIPAGSLPRRYRRSVEDFPVDGAYLVPDAERVSAWRARLGPRKSVGISWRSTGTGPERLREYAALAEWEPVLTQPDTSLVSLQAGDCEDELAEVERSLGVQIRRWAGLDLVRDFEELAALVAALDYVVAPRGWIGHLAGALGTDTAMVANPYPWTELGTGTLPWFPAVTVVHRTPGDGWVDAIATAAHLIAQSERPTPRPALAARRPRTR
jgi:tetratricopeptide (TPR) repeat protein